MEYISEAGWWALEFALVSVLLLGAYRLRPRLGMSAVVAVVVSLQVFQVVMVTSFYWEISQGFLVSPGSAILFASNLALLLYAFGRDGIVAARNILYAIVIGNLVIQVVGWVLFLHIEYSNPVNFLDIPVDIFYQGAGAALLGISVLYVDQVLALLGFSWLRKRAPGLPISLPLTITLVAVLIFDTLIYLTLLYFDHDQYWAMLQSGVVAKSLGGLAFGAVWGLYLQRRMVSETEDLQDVLKFLLFRDDIEALREAASRDSLTNLYNRRTFDRIIRRLLNRKEQNFSLILCDMDHFKKVNDNLGHAVGDSVLQNIAAHLQDSVREMDFTFRLGGDEFAVLLPRCDMAHAREVARRLSDFSFDDVGLPRPVTLTIGIATFPDDGTTFEALYERADSRLYAGKDAGRAVIVTDNEERK